FATPQGLLGFAPHRPAVAVIPGEILHPAADGEGQALAEGGGQLAVEGNAAGVVITGERPRLPEIPVVEIPIKALALVLVVEPRHPVEGAEQPAGLAGHQAGVELHRVPLAAVVVGAGIPPVEAPQIAVTG